MSGGCAVSLADQLIELVSLRPGWHNGEGEPISAQTLVEAVRRVCVHIDAGNWPPYLYPRIDGGISVEWDDPEPGGFVIEPVRP